VPYLDLGCQPLANALIGPEFNPQHETVAPLAVVLCQECGLSQLTVVVDPEILYSGYRFRSGVTRAWRNHCDDLAIQATPGASWYPAHPIGKRMLDIAANDGCCMASFKKYGWTVLGVDPSPAPRVTGGLHPEQPISDLPIIRGFWGKDMAEQVRLEHGLVNLIVAQNVLGHVDDPIGFLTAAESVLVPDDGMIVVEVPSVTDLIANGAFDTIYHEHLSYWNTAAMIRCARQANLTLHRMEKLKVHGGSRRYWFRRGGELAEKVGLGDMECDLRLYTKFARDVKQNLYEVMTFLSQLKADSMWKHLWAYGASAKGAVFLNALKARGNTVWPERIIDDVPEKQGMLSPGLHIPITGWEEIDQCDALWVLSWNWAEQMKAEALRQGFKGQFLTTTPDVRLDG